MDELHSLTVKGAGDRPLSSAELLSAITYATHYANSTGTKDIAVIVMPEPGPKQFTVFGVHADHPDIRFYGFAAQKEVAP